MNEVVNDMNAKIQQKLNKLREIGVSNVEELITALQKEDIHFSPSEFPALGRFITTTFGKHSDLYPIPEWLAEVFSTIAQSHTANSICDPYAQIGLLIGIMQEVTQAKSVTTYTMQNSEAVLGNALVGDAEWKVGNPVELISSLDDEIDIVASILPWEAKMPQFNVSSPKGYDIELKYNFGHLILIESCKHLNTDGIGLFVVMPSFFYSPYSVLPQFSALGLGLEAALELPPGTFAPQTNISSYLLIVRKHSVSKMFVAQLSSDSKTNYKILSNLANGKEGSSLELGQFVDVQSFKGLDEIRIQEKLKKAENQFGKPVLPLKKLATTINLGHYGESFQFPKQENTIFIPLIGISDVVDSHDKIKLKPQNYAQVVIDPKLSSAHFVVNFLNSELGKEIREFHKFGAVIPKLSKQKLEELQILIPPLNKQKDIIKIEMYIAAKKNTLLGLQGELELLQRDIWTKPWSADEVEQRLSIFSNQFSVNIKHQTEASFNHWAETLPFPLSSILRIWQKNKSKNFKEKYQLLLYFFEATAEFLSMILLSAFRSNQSLFENQWQKLTELDQDHKLSFQQATFGSWKIVFEYLSKQTRELLKDENEGRKLCMEMFADSSLRLPTVVSEKKIAPIFSITNKIRNDWKGHSGNVGEKEAELLHEQLFCEVQKLRNIMSDIWTEVELIHSPYFEQNFDVFESEVTILMGSNSEFLREKRSMYTSLDKNFLYLSKKDEPRALRLIPLVQFGPSPETPKNACYFYNKVEKKNLKFVSYHFTDPSSCEVSTNTKMSEQLRIFWETK